MTEHPTIPEIVESLNAIHERHGQKLIDVCEAYEEKLKALKSEDLPPLQDGEYFHFEYVSWNPVEEGGYYSNMVDVAYSREKALSRLRELITDEGVYAIHVRRYEMPDKNVHAYDEIQRLPVAQSQAYMQRLRADKLEKDHDEIVTAKAELETGYDQIVTGLEDTIEAQERVIRTLVHNIQRTMGDLARDNANCVVSEPLDYMRRLVGMDVGKPVEQLADKMLREAKEKVRKDRKTKEAIERAMATGDWPPAPFVHGGATSNRRCACALVWHMDEVPPWHNGLACQTPTHEEQVAWARKTTVWPPAKPREGADPLSRFCACGKEWERDKVPPRHNGLECQPEKCETRFNGGMCAGEKGHEGQCSPHPGHHGKCLEKDCNHLESSHVVPQPNDGIQIEPFCSECTTPAYQHAFKSVPE